MVNNCAPAIPDQLYNSIRSFLDELRDKILSVDLSDGLGLAKVYGSLAWSNHVNIYSAPEIEDYLFSTFIKLKALPNKSALKNGKILHVLSECYLTGGHTRVVERLLCETKELQYQDVIITGLCKSEIIAKINSYGSTVSFVKSRGVLAVEEMINLMQKYEFVLLHINPDDIVSALAARVVRETGTKVGLYNHADHCFSYGFKSVDMVFEVSIYGRELSQKYRHSYKWSFAGIPLDCQPLLNDTTEGDYFLSSGPDYKYDFRENKIFARLLEELIPKSNKKCIIIGPTLLKSNASTKLHNFVKTGQLIVLPPVKYDDYILYLKDCFAYLDSSPVAGGSAFPEAAMSGKHCLGLRNSIMGYSPVDTIRSRSIEELVLRAVTLPKSGDPNHIALLQDVHQPSNVLKRILAGLRGERVFDVPYKIETEEIDTNYMHLKWLENEKFSIITAGFESLTLIQRLHFLMSLKQHGLSSQFTLQHKLRIFITNMSYRKFRSYPLRRLHLEMMRSTTRLIISVSVSVRDFLLAARFRKDKKLH